MTQLKVEGTVSAPLLREAAALRVPDGWTIELISRCPDYLVISTPPPLLMATVDFRLRGFRSGWATTGRLVGATWERRYSGRRLYKGRGWKQKLVDDVVDYLQVPR